MQPSLEPQTDSQKWIYADLTVFDGPRKLKPTHAAFDRLRFAQPPRLSGEQIEIILINGDAEQRHRAAVLPHDPDATRIPIRLLAME
jgi:hypothetical protein